MIEPHTHTRTHTHTCTHTHAHTHNIHFIFLFHRAIVWLQNKRDATLERVRGPSPRREDAHEYRIGRLKHERVTVPRDESLLDWAQQVMKYHAERKSILEVSQNMWYFLHVSGFRYLGITTYLNCEYKLGGMV